MSRFNAPPPNGDSRKMIEQRARDAARPAVPEKKGTWPFPANQHPHGASEENREAAGYGNQKKQD